MDLTGLVDYGALGIFVLYLAYDRQVLLKDLKDTIKENTSAMRSMGEHFSSLTKKLNGSQKK